MSLFEHLSKIARPAALALLLMLSANATQAAVFIKFDGVDGAATEATDFEIKPFGQTVLIGLLLPAVQKVREAASRPDLAALACDGTVVPSLIVEVPAAGGRKPLRYELTNAFVTSYAMMSDGAGHPKEQVALNFARAEWTYVESGETFGVDCSSGRCICAP